MRVSRVTGAASTQSIAVPDTDEPDATQMLDPPPLREDALRAQPKGASSEASELEPAPLPVVAQLRHADSVAPPVSDDDVMPAPDPVETARPVTTVHADDAQARSRVERGGCAGKDIFRDYRGDGDVLRARATYCVRFDQDDYRERCGYPDRRLRWPCPRTDAPHRPRSDHAGTIADVGRPGDARRCASRSAHARPSGFLLPC